MAAPAPPLQTCLLVSYLHGYANPTGNGPYIGVFARMTPGDDITPGILMRVERCTGAGCSGFAFRGNGAVRFVGSGNPQAEYIDTGAYGTLYRYRVRFENADGNSAFSATVDIDTTIQGTSACDTGNTSTLNKQVRLHGSTLAIEWTLNQINHYGGVLIIEHGQPGEVTLPPVGPPPPTPPPGVFGCEDEI